MAMTVLEQELAHSQIRANSEIVKKLNVVDNDQCRYLTANMVFPMFVAECVKHGDFMTFEGAVEAAAKKAVECSDVLLKALHDKGWPSK